MLSTSVGSSRGVARDTRLLSRGGARFNCHYQRSLVPQTGNFNDKHVSKSPRFLVNYQFRRTKFAKRMYDVELRDSSKLSVNLFSSCFQPIARSFATFDGTALAKFFYRSHDRDRIEAMRSKRRYSNVETVVRLIKTLGKLTSTWPPDPENDFRKFFFTELLWFVSFVNVLGLVVALILAAYHYRHDLGTAMKSLSELTALGDVFFNLIICKFQRRRLQKLLSEITNYVDNAKETEKIVLQSYVDRYLPFLISVGSCYLTTAIIFSCGPVFMNTRLPADAWYPFSTEAWTTNCGIYVHQVLAIMQTGFCITVDVMIGMMLWYASARLEMLCAKIKDATNVTELNVCISEHQQLIEFARETASAVRFIILKGNATMAMVIICGGFPLIHHEPLLVVSQFVGIVFSGLFRLYVSAWPADDLAQMSENVGLSTYHCDWVDGSPEMRKSLMFVMQRSQKPLVISVVGVIPALTLRFYASFVSSTLSYFMTIRAIFGE